MEPISGPEEQPSSDAVSAQPLRLSDYFWHPCIAKIWWATSLTWWACFILAQQTGWLQDYFENAVAGYLNVLFFPGTIIMALGVPLAWDKLDRGDWVVSPLPLTSDHTNPPRSVGGMRDPASDPLDPRSGILHWRKFHPED